MTSTLAAPRHKHRKSKPLNAIDVALQWWFASLPEDVLGNHDVQGLTGLAPKRWVIYEPMALLPQGSFTSQPWQDILRAAPERLVEELWQAILTEISKTCSSTLTHLAANEGIPLRRSDAEENILRSPSGLRILHGDFGPSSLDDAERGVTRTDLEKAFWVSTKQNGIYQTWAPRWTMFSRGNVKEKARLLDFHTPSPPERSGNNFEHRRHDRTGLKDKWAIDLYAGIGYFVFSYAKLGSRVLGWELNPWSVEGLRRGALGNGWSVRVVQGLDLECTSIKDILQGGERIIVFLESNEMARSRLTGPGVETMLDVIHVNCGFLPTSEPTWRDAWELVRASGRVWLHLHENVGTEDINSRKEEIQERFRLLAGGEALVKVQVEHCELVKTFAPGVWHCVFDVYITRSR